MYSLNFQTNGQASAYRFAAIFNPLGSGFQLMLHGASVLGYATTATSSGTPLVLSRITSSAGGVLQSNSLMNKFVTAYPDSVAQVRSGNPTVTPGSRIYSFAPPVQGLTISAFAAVPQPVHFDTELILQPGEGFVFHQEASGTTAHQYNIYVCWTEQPT